MLRLLQKFIQSAISTNRRLSKSATKVSHLSWTRYGIMSRFATTVFFNYRNIRRFLMLYIYGNIVTALILSIIFILLISSKGLLVGWGYSEYLKYSPISISDIGLILSWIWSFSGAWLALVFINHWNDLSALMISSVADGSLSSYLGCFSGLVYTVNYIMIKEFIICLFSNPSELLNTRVVWEFILLGDNISFIWRESTTTFWSILTTWTAGTSLNSVVLLIKGVLSSSFDWCIDNLRSVLVGSWNLLHGWILGVITPVTHPLIQPIVDNIARPVASAALISILM